MNFSLLILTGQSGSGKSTAMRALEDHGFFCVDNLPTELVESLVQIIRAAQPSGSLALVMDVRGRQFLKQAPALVKRLRKGDHSTRLVYLEAAENALIRRYSETRRQHPLDTGCGLRTAIEREQELLSPLRELSDQTMDTTDLSPQELRSRVIEQLALVRPEDLLKIAVVSFGFKHGVPLDADMVLDVRFLPNPFFLPSLRELNGLHASVQQHVTGSPEGIEFLAQAQSFLAFLILKYQKEGRRYLTIAIGCTGGQHRSVAITEALANMLESQGIGVDRRHRDLVETRT